MKVRIISAPQGEAPLHIREAWIGLELDVIKGSPVAYLAQGVLTGARSWFGQLSAVVRGRFKAGVGYPVNAAEAVEVLERTNPEAAAWWRKNVPHLFDAGRTFVFTASACKPVRSAEADVARGLREQAFTMDVAVPASTAASDSSRPLAFFMETGYPEAVASLECFADGTTSLYFSTGGGIIGAGQHDTVRAAAAQLLAVAQQHADQLAVADSHPLPALGRVRFYLRMPYELRSGDEAEAILSEGKHALSPLFTAGHAVIAAVREKGTAQEVLPPRRLR